MNSTNQNSSLSEVFLGLFHKHKRNSRVLLPLLSTLDKLLAHKYLDELLCAESRDFCPRLMTCLESEARGCGDIKLLLAIVGVSFALLEPHPDTMSTVRLESCIPCPDFWVCLSYFLLQIRCERIFFPLS